MTSLRRTVIKLVIFAVVAIIITISVVATLLDLKIGEPQGSFHAVFANATGLQPGDIVRVAGIEEGKVNAVHLTKQDTARVDFTVATSQHLTTTTKVSIAFQNLLGQRYLSVNGEPGGVPLKAGSTIPMSRTVDGLDLTTVFTGFQPLLAALNPGQVNELTGSIVEVLQGQSGAIQNLMSQTATLTANLAQRGDVIDEVLDNLTPLLSAVSGSDANIGKLIDGLETVVTKLNAPSTDLGGAISSADQLTRATSGLISGAQPALDQDLQKLVGATGVLERNEVPLSGVVRDLTPLLRTLNKVSSSGSYLNVYLCDLSINVSGPVSVDLAKQSEPLTVPSGIVGNRQEHFGVCS